MNYSTITVLIGCKMTPCFVICFQEEPKADDSKHFGFIFSIVRPKDTDRFVGISTQGDRKPGIMLTIKTFEQCVLEKKCIKNGIFVNDVILHFDTPPIFFESVDGIDRESVVSFNSDDAQEMGGRVEMVKHSIFTVPAFEQNCFQNDVEKNGPEAVLSSFCNNRKLQNTESLTNNELPLKYIAAVLHGHGNTPATREEVRNLDIQFDRDAENEKTNATHDSYLQLITIGLKDRPEIPKFKIVIGQPPKYQADDTIKNWLRNESTKYALVYRPPATLAPEKCVATMGQPANWLLNSGEQELYFNTGDNFKVINYNKPPKEDHVFGFRFAAKIFNSEFFGNADAGSLHLPVPSIQNTWSYDDDEILRCWSDDEHNIIRLKTFVKSQRDAGNPIVVIMATVKSDEFDFDDFLQRFEDYDSAAFVMIGFGNPSNHPDNMIFSKYMHFEDLHLLKPDLVLSGCGAGTLSSALAQGLVVTPLFGGVGEDKELNMMIVVGMGNHLAIGKNAGPTFDKNPLHRVSENGQSLSQLDKEQMDHLLKQLKANKDTYQANVKQLAEQIWHEEIRIVDSVQRSTAVDVLVSKATEE